MSYNFSISGHVDTEAAEWSLIQTLAAAAQASGASTAQGSTQFHGLVNLLSVQASTPDVPVAEGTQLASAVQPQAVVNEAGEVVGFGPPEAPDGSPAPGLVFADAAAPAAPDGPVVVTTETPGVQTNTAGEVVGTVDAEQTPNPAIPGDVVPLVQASTPGLKPLYNAKGEILGYVEG